MSSIDNQSSDPLSISQLRTPQEDLVWEDGLRSEMDDNHNTVIIFDKHS